MPRNQVAHVPVIQLGPGNPSGVYQVRKGTRLQGKFEADEDNVTVSIQTSADNATWAATTANDHGQAVTAAAVVAKGEVDFSINLRHQRDNYIRFIVTGGPVNLQLRGEEDLEILKLPG